MFYRLLLCCLLYLTTTNLIKGQNNLISNPSFEHIELPPIGWYYNGKDFSNTVQSWYSPTSSSPDYYGPTVIVPSTWKSKGFGKTKPKEGKAMAGITVYGCGNGKAHCREYLAISLTEKLVIGQTYRVSFFVKHLPNTKYVKNIGVAFAPEKLEIPIDTLLGLEPLIKLNNHDLDVDYKWKKVSTTFTAKAAMSELIIGNFDSDDASEIISSPNDLGYSYYYVDMVELTKTPPFLPTPSLDDSFLQVGKAIYIRGLHFNSAKYELDTEAKNILNKVVAQLAKDDNLGVEIHGHTDSIGSDSYNELLAQRRARAVFDYLLNAGIEGSNMKFFSHGEQKPIDSNQSESGRYQNRRVEIIPFHKNKKTALK